MRIRLPELETRICDVKCHVSLVGEHCDVLSMQMDSDLVIYRTTLVRISKWLPFVEWISLRSWLYRLALITRNIIDTLRDRTVMYANHDRLVLAGTIRDTYGIMGSWGDVARRFTMIRWLVQICDIGVAIVVDPRLAVSLNH
ncbi:hypothetical protein F511_15494 [Dorcoceras hygrometricum]|uniref:Uncharacterized protein n=1 Tax=Dorcoceras hygrometricum TaxID=472368 RepID=A0A2Z7BPJ6_9LAMI|nr:hypothetical protein F511_15494 [Dorcoceras hygrometricum]